MKADSLQEIEPSKLNSAIEFESAIKSFRPTLHKYCTRMTGSVIDGEDVLQSTLIKAYEALDRSAKIDSWEAWLFQIAHNTAMDFFRRQSKHQAIQDGLAMETEEYNEPKHLISDDLQQLAVLPPLQRSVLLLRELFGYKTSEVAELLHTSPEAVKSALHRSRETLKKVTTLPSKQTENVADLDNGKIKLIKHYTELFNARAFDDMRDLLLHEVKLDMVNKTKLNGRTEVSGYYGNYQRKDDWYMEPGFIEGKPAVLAFDKKGSTSPPNYFILLEFEEDSVRFIRDFRYADYVMEHAQWQRV